MKKIYLGLIIIAILIFIIGMVVFENTRFIAPIMIAISIYLFVGSLIKLCKMNDKLKNTVICALDLLFWVP